MAFHDVRLPEDIEKGSSGGPGFSTTVLPLSSGREQRNQNWSQQRCRYDVSYGILTKDDETTAMNYHDVYDFFMIRRGKLHSFRFKDWADFEIVRQSIGVGDAANPLFQIYRRYTDGANHYDRIITRPVQGTVKVWVDNSLKTETTHYTIDYAKGLITFTMGNIPGEAKNVEVECEFDVPVRFDIDEMSVQLETFAAGSIPRIPLVEIREYD